MTQPSGLRALGRSPLALGVRALAVLAVFVVVSNRGGGEAGVAYGADEARTASPSIPTV